MIKITRLTLSYFYQIFIILIFFTTVYFLRSYIFSDYNRQVDLYTTKLIKNENIITKQNIKLFAENDKNHFSNKVDTLILFFFFCIIFTINFQKQIHKQKKQREEFHFLIKKRN